MPLASDIIKNNLDGLKEKFSKIISEGDFNYKNFGTAIEEYCEKELIDLLIKNGINDFVPAENKNKFPDLKINTNPIEAIDYKSGNHAKKSGGEWTECNNSGNDLGTFNSLSEKIEEFGGDNIYFFWIEYIINDTQKELVEIKFDHFYKFVGLSPDGLIKYREKDGNIRPKNFNDESPMRDYKSFNELVEKTQVKRSINISEKHLGFLKDKLKKKYDI